MDHEAANGNIGGLGSLCWAVEADAEIGKGEDSVSIFECGCGRWGRETVLSS